MREMEDPPYYIEIVSIEEGEIVKDRSLRLMLGAMNERKVLEGRKSTEKRHTNALAKGVPPIKAPFGYWNDRNMGNWAVNEKEKAVVVELWKMFVDGVDYKEICKKLNLPFGKYYRMVDNFENYLGKIIYRKKIKNFKGRVLKVDKLVFDGQHEAILKDKKLIEKIKSKLQSSKGLG